jgi:hypothetical protein
MELQEDSTLLGHRRTHRWLEESKSARYGPKMDLVLVVHKDFKGYYHDD